MLSKTREVPVVSPAPVVIPAVALVAFLISLAASNNARVKVNWVFGSSHVSLVWLVLFAAILGWLLGPALSATVHRGASRAAFEPGSENPRLVELAARCKGVSARDRLDAERWFDGGGSFSGQAVTR